MLTILGENASIPHLLPENFPLSKSLGERLRGVSESLHNGRGFAVLRGLDPARYSDRENVALFVGLSGYVGDKRGFKLSKYRKHSTFSKSTLIQPQITCTTARNQAKIHPGSCLHTYRSQWYEQEPPSTAHKVRTDTYRLSTRMSVAETILLYMFRARAVKVAESSSRASGKSTTGCLKNTHDISSS